MIGKKHKKSTQVIWLVVSIIAVLSMVAFTILPLLTSY